MSVEEPRPQFDASAAQCLAALRAGAPWEALADELARAAAAPETAAEASRALFADVVEPLADSFDPHQAAAYESFFRRVLRTVRKLPGFEAVDAELASCKAHPREPIAWERVQKVAVLSRVTLGADIAVASVCLRAALGLPSVRQTCFVAGPKNLELFAGEERIQPVEVRYPRSGTLAERLSVWLDARRTVAGLAEGLAPGELVVLDPDSRITQLGLLPAAPAEQHSLFFNSRVCRDGEPGSLAAITAEWLEDTIGPQPEAPLPWLALPPADLERAEALRREAAGPLAGVNFGVGGNAAKRVGDPFESGALDALLERGYRILLDAGFGAEERARAGGLVRPGVSLHEGSFSSFAAVIGTSDLFLGYDSGAAHAAAAMGVRAIDVFRGAPTEIMRSRWSPWGKRPAVVVPVDAGEGPENVLRRLQELLG